MEVRADLTGIPVQDDVRKAICLLFFANLGHLRKVTVPITTIYNFDGICSYPDQYTHLNASILSIIRY